MVSNELFIGLPLILVSIILTEIAFLSSDKSEQSNLLRPFKSLFIRFLIIPLLLLFISSFLAFADLLSPSHGLINISIIFFGASYPLLIMGTVASLSFVSMEIYE